MELEAPRSTVAGAPPLTNDNEADALTAHCRTLPTRDSGGLRVRDKRQKRAFFLVYEEKASSSQCRLQRRDAYLMWRVIYGNGKDMKAKLFVEFSDYGFSDNPLVWPDNEHRQ